MVHGREHDGDNGMKILYGVVGEGMGHATRSRVIIDHLAKRHDVHIVVSGRAHALLQSRFEQVTEIEGFSISFDGDAVDRSRTFWNTLKRLPNMVSRNFDAFIELSERFRPELVISDFESFAHFVARHYELPVISLDNMQIINRCSLELEIAAEDEPYFQNAKALVKSKLPGCNHYLITTFFFPPVRKKRTSLYPPVLRPEILHARPSIGEHLLVYRSSSAHESLLDVLHEADVPCRVYGFDREETLGKLALRPFSEQGFVDDLASSRGVIAPGGFTLMGEAIYLRKPVLALPLRKHFEQLLNALYLEKLGYGSCCRTLDAGAIRAFWRDLEQYGRALAGYQQDGNRLILSALDRLLDEFARGS